MEKGRSNFFFNRNRFCTICEIVVLDMRRQFFFYTTPYAYYDAVLFPQLFIFVYPLILFCSRFFFLSCFRPARLTPQWDTSRQSIFRLNQNVSSINDITAFSRIHILRKKLNTSRGNKTWTECEENLGRGVGKKITEKEKLGANLVYFIFRPFRRLDHVEEAARAQFYSCSFL